MCTYTSSNCNAIIALQFIIVVSQQKQKDPPIQTRLVHWSSSLSVTSWLLESCDRCFCCIVSAFSECFRRVMWLSVTQTSSRVRSWKPHTDSSKQIFTGGPRSLPDAADTLPAGRCWKKGLGPEGAMADGERSPLLPDQHDGTNGFSPGTSSHGYLPKPQSNLCVLFTSPFRIRAVINRLQQRGIVVCFYL